MKEDGSLNYKFIIPFNTTATLKLPDAGLETVRVSKKNLAETNVTAVQRGKNVYIELTSGVWEFDYTPTKEYFKRYSTNTPLADILSNTEAGKILIEAVPQVTSPPKEELLRDVREP